MTSEERQKKLRELELPTARVRKQILEIFTDLAFSKRNEQQFFLIAEIGYAVNAVWDGHDKPSLVEIEFYLDQAAADKAQNGVTKHAQFGYRYIFSA